MHRTERRGFVWEWACGWSRARTTWIRRSLWGARSLWSSEFWFAFRGAHFDGFDARDIAYEGNLLIWSIHHKGGQALWGDPFTVRRAIREGVE